MEVHNEPIMNETVRQPFKAIGTSNHGFGQQAQEEIRRLLDGQAAFQWLMPNEVYLIRSPLAHDEALQRVLENEPVFLRHLQPVNEEVAWAGGQAELLNGIRKVLEAGAVHGAMRIAVQFRKGSGAPEEASPGILKPLVDELLAESFGAVPVTNRADRILSVFFAGETAYIGISPPEHNLSDWPGGAIRFRREEGQISRAKFKLLEAELAFGLDFSQYRNALDVGAAPGGWTSLLLERGLEVTAVDPAKLAPQLLKHPRLTYYGKKADQVAFADASFDLLVCDMSWSPHLMARLIKGLARVVVPGGTVIVTVKLMHKKALQTIREVSGVLEPELALQKAKQLFHNREELTLFLVKT